MDHGRDVPVFALIDVVGRPSIFCFLAVARPHAVMIQGLILTLMSIHVVNQRLEKGAREYQFMDGYKFVVAEVRLSMLLSLLSA
jgi:hypothetical protein